MPETLNPPAALDLALLKALLDGVPARVALIDRQHRFVYANDETLAFLQLTTEQLIGRTVQQVRGDGVMNPRPIPDLAGVGARSTHGHGNDPSLEHFVHSVIEEEFQGEPPPPQAFDDLIAYLRAFNAHMCGGETPMRLRDGANDVRRAMAAAESADAPTASALLLAAQDAMGRLVERLPESRFAGDRAALETLARELGAMRYADHVLAALQNGAPGWNARFDAAVKAITPRERTTYFNEPTLSAALSPR